MLKVFILQALILKCNGSVFIRFVYETICMRVHFPFLCFKKINEYIRKTNTRNLAELLRLPRTCLRHRTIAAGSAMNSKDGQTILPLAQKKNLAARIYLIYWGSDGQETML